MNPYLWLKTVHIISSVLLVGTGLGSAFYMFFANRTDSVAAKAVISRLVVRADWWFTTPCVLVQPISGIAPGTHGWLAAQHAVAGLVAGAVCAGWCLLAACGLAANSHGAHGTHR